MAAEIDQISEEDLKTTPDDDEPEALVTYDISAYPSDLTLSGIRDMWKQGDIVIPEFQRNYVWTIKQASLLIESFLIGLPVPQVFFYIDEDNKNLVIDGQQRIKSAVYFFEGYFGDESDQGKRQVFRLAGLDERSPFAGKRYVDLLEADQRRLRSAVLRAINIRQLSPKEENTSIYHIFERLNTGGTPLKPQEIRNCVFRGGFAQTLRELNRLSAWREIIGKVALDKHQKDIELILRVFALSDEGWKSYEKPMKEFLNKAMKANQDGQTDRVRLFAQQFPVAISEIVRQLGSKPFHIRGPLNSSTMDSVVAVLVDGAARIPTNLAERFEALSRNKDFDNATLRSTSDVVVLTERFERANQILLG